MRSGLTFWTVSSVLLLTCIIGCQPDGTIVLPGTANLMGSSANEVEPNSDFSSPQELDVPTDSVIDVNANLSSLQDIDIYDLGAISAGERLTVTANCNSSLDLAAAVFDENQCLLSTSDDRSWQTDNRPSLSVTVRHNCGHCYVAIAASPYVDSAQGSYTLTIMRETSTQPAARVQVLYLNFAGGSNVMLPNMTQANIPAFTAGSIDSSYANQTAAMREAIIRHVQGHYARFNVQIVSSAQTSVVPQNATILQFGLYNPDLLGLADNVDEYNTDLTQMAIIFTDTFRLFMPLRPTVEEMAISIANVASHEAGHLLGLEHTSDWADLMDTTAPADALLEVQTFKTAPLYDMVFPVGQQDGAMLLGETLGFNANAAANNIDRSSLFANTVASADNGPSSNVGVVPSSSATPGITPAVASARRLLLYGQRSGQGYVSKDFFAVHSRRSVSH